MPATPPSSTENVRDCDRCAPRQVAGRVVVNDFRETGVIYRRRVCPICGHRWSSTELRIDPATQVVVVVPRDVAKQLQSSVMSLLEVLGEMKVIKTTTD